MLFAPQPLYCTVCGAKDDRHMPDYGPITCSRECREEYEWRKTLYTMGRPYHPRTADAAPTE